MKDSTTQPHRRKALCENLLRLLNSLLHRSIYPYDSHFSSAAVMCLTAYNYSVQYYTASTTTHGVKVVIPEVDVAIGQLLDFVIVYRASRDIGALEQRLVEYNDTCTQYKNQWEPKKSPKKQITPNSLLIATCQSRRSLHLFLAEEEYLLPLREENIALVGGGDPYENHTYNEIKMDETDGDGCSCCKFFLFSLAAFLTIYLSMSGMSAYIKLIGQSQINCSECWAVAAPLLAVLLLFLPITFYSASLLKKNNNTYCDYFTQIICFFLAVLGGISALAISSSIILLYVGFDLEHFYIGLGCGLLLFVSWLYCIDKGIRPTNQPQPVLEPKIRDEGSEKDEDKEYALYSHRRLNCERAYEQYQMTCTVHEKDDEAREKAFEKYKKAFELYLDAYDQSYRQYECEEFLEYEPVDEKKTQIYDQHIQACDDYDKAYAGMEEDRVYEKNQQRRMRESEVSKEKEAQEVVEEKIFEDREGNCCIM